jgi:membrane protein
MATAVDERAPASGVDAESPTEVPGRGWLEVAKRVKAEVKQDNISLLAAGLAYYALIALVPGLIALVSIYGLFADPADVERQVAELTTTLPEEAQDLLTQQLRDIVNSSSGGLGVAAVAGLAVALWSASSGMKQLVAALDVTYDEDESRGFLKVRGLSLLFTIGGILFAAVAFFAITLLPSLLEEVGLGSEARTAVNLSRWPLLAVGLLVGLATLFRFGPDRDDPEFRWVSPGALIAVVVWLAGSIGFSIYTENFASYNETYGSLGAVVILLLWLYLSAFVILLAAEINAELERQTEADTTVGPDEPMGQRGAVVADQPAPQA